MGRSGIPAICIFLGSQTVFADVTSPPPEWVGWGARIIEVEPGVRAFYAVGVASGTDDIAIRRADNDGRLAMAQMRSMQVTVTKTSEGVQVRVQSQTVSVLNGVEAVDYWQDESHNVTYALMQQAEAPAAQKKIALRPWKSPQRSFSTPSWARSRAGPSMQMQGDLEVYTAVGRAGVTEGRGRLDRRAMAIRRARTGLAEKLADHKRCAAQSPPKLEATSEITVWGCALKNVELPGVWVDRDGTVYVRAQMKLPAATVRPRPRPAWINDHEGDAGEITRFVREQAGTVSFVGITHWSTWDGEAKAVVQAKEVAMQGVCYGLFDFGLVKWPVRWVNKRQKPCLVKGMKVQSWTDSGRRRVYAHAQVDRKRKGRRRCTTPSEPRLRGVGDLVRWLAPLGKTDPTVRLGDVLTTGSRSPSQVVAVMKSHADRIATCAGASEGQFRTRLTVSKSGRVRKAKILDYGRQTSQSVSRCMKKVLSKVKFQKAACPGQMVFSVKFAKPSSGS